MPLTDFQRTVIEVLRPFRNRRNFVGGGAALNQKWPRLSDDMDLFGDMRGGLPRSVDREIAALRAADYTVRVDVETDWTVDVIVRKYGFETRVQWMDEPGSSRRFFDSVPDEELGFRLHQADLAINKVLCAASRDRSARDAVDLLNIVHSYCPLGPLVWACVGKDPDLAPPAIIRSMRANTFGYSDEEIRTVSMEEGEAVTRMRIREVLQPAFEAASDYCENLAPTNFLGHLFIDAHETPYPATIAELEHGMARNIAVNDFSEIPRIPN